MATPRQQSTPRHRGKPKPSGRAVKIHRSYTVEEAARATGYAKGNVRRWVSSGLLPALTDQRPHLILGADLDALRRIVKHAFARAGLPYYHPHTFRHTLARHGEKMRLTPEEWQAYSQNFGHSNPMTTFTTGRCRSTGRRRSSTSLRSLAIRAGSMNIDDLSNDQLRELLNGLASRFGPASGSSSPTS